MTTERNPPATGDKHPCNGESQRDYPHGSGDRNTKKSESDWKEFEGGTQRDAPPAPSADES